MPRVLALGLLVSGEGTTLEALSEAITGGHLPARIALVVADRSHAPAIERARRRGLPTAVIPTHGVPREEWAPRLTRALVDCGTELVVLAGFLSILPPAWLGYWRGRVINVHPSLLPRFGGMGMYGRRVLEATLAAHDRETGATVHLVNEDVDAGPILAQERIRVDPGETSDSLRARLRPVELHLLESVIRQFAEGALPLPYTGPPESAPTREGDRRPQ